MMSVPQDDIFYIVIGMFVLSGAIYLISRYLIKKYSSRIIEWYNTQRRESQTNARPFFSIQRSTRRIIEGIRPSPKPQLIINENNVFRVGETNSFKISLPEPRTMFTSSTSTLVPNTNSMEVSQNSVRMSSLVSIEIRKITGGSSPDKISFVQEVVRQGTEDFILVKYSVRESGFYELLILYQGSHITNSPYLLTFVPTQIDTNKTLLLRHSPTILAQTDSDLIITVEPRDRFGNLCRSENFNLANFKFEVTKIDESSNSEVVETIAYEFCSNIKDDWGEFQCEVILHLEVFIPGFFSGSVSYENKEIGNGSFDIVSLTPEENINFEEILKKPPGTVYQEAKILIYNLEVERKARSIFIYISQKFLTVKEYYLGFVPYKLAVYKIMPGTKIRLLKNNTKSHDCVFSIYDRSQPKLTIEMNCGNFRLLMACFAHYLKQRLGGSESFENKQKFFYDELKQVREDKNRSFVNIPVNRDNIIDSSLNATKYFGAKEWCRKSKVQFQGEEGHDDGGLRREWLEMLCSQMFDNDANGMFCAMGISRLVHPNPNRNTKKWTLRHYEFAGKIVGKCLFETAVGGFYKQMVNGRFTRSFLAHLIGSYPQIKHFEQDDPDFHLTKIRYISENDITSMDLCFQEEIYDEASGKLIKTVDLVPNGKNVKVTNDNKAEYLTALAQFRLGSRVQEEIDSFLKGLNLIIPDGLLTNFDENELEILMCGKSSFVVSDMKEHAVISECTNNDVSCKTRLIEWFWNSVEGMTEEERGRLLQFTTGSSLLPHGGFKELLPPFRITITNTKNHLPIAHTCFSEICLSSHATFEEFNKSLLLAINECSEGFAMI